MASGIVETTNQNSEEEEKQQHSLVPRVPMVQRLLDAPNLPAFVTDLIATQVTTVVGTEAAAFFIERTAEALALRLVSHLRGDNSKPEVREAAVRAFMDLIRPFVEEGKDGVKEIGPPGDIYHPESQYLLVTLLRAEGQAVAVSAVVTKCMNIDRAKQRLQSMQLVAGYFELFTLRHNADQSRLLAQSHQDVLQLATAVATAEGFESAAMNLCNELANRSGASRVSLGWLKGRNIKVKALSHTEEFDKKQDLIVSIERVMEECADQEEIVSFTPGGNRTENVTREAQAYSRSQGGNTVLSLPLRHRAEVCGVVTMEFLPNTTIDPRVNHSLAVSVELLAPQLYDRHLNDRWLITKAGLSLKSHLQKVTGPRYMLAKVLVVVGLVGLFLLCQPWYTPMYHVSAPFEFSAPNKMVLVAPFEAKLVDIGRTKDGEPLRPGDKVTKGQVLAQLDTHELSDREIDAIKRMGEAQKEKEKYLNMPGKIADANIAAAREEAARAEVSLYKRQLEDSTIRAPEDGAILKGDLSSTIGQRLQPGQDLFWIAPENDPLRATLKVADRDIQNIKVGSVGNIATEALPMEKFPVRVTRVIPLPNASEGSNSYEVYAEPDPAQIAARHPVWRVGMTGEARIDVEHKPLIWIWTHRLTDFLRLKLWM